MVVVERNAENRNPAKSTKGGLFPRLLLGDISGVTVGFIYSLLFISGPSSCYDDRLWEAGGKVKENDN